MINGVINIYKEKDFTSHDVVAKLRGILKQKKIGHTGTLDPQATGVLPVCLGRATKLCDLLTDKNKTYVTVLRLGTITDTQDMTGTILEQRPVEVSAQQVKSAVLSFVGEQMQVPPMYSALKVNGKKLYELARDGKEIERAARRVCFYEIEIIKIELPEVTIRVTCSKGTYIRTLCHDIGQLLTCGGCMQELERTQVERFSIENSLTLSQLEQLNRDGVLKPHILSIEAMFAQYPKVVAQSHQDKALHNGNAVFHPKSPVTESFVRMFDSNGLFIGIYQYAHERDCYALVKMFMEEP